MSQRIQTIHDQLRESREYLDSILDQVGDRWETQIYSDGLEWTVRQIVVHLASADSGHNNQVMNIAEGRDLIPEDFDIERFNRRVTEKSTDKSVEEARNELSASRQQLNQWLFTIDESVLENKGRHASLRVLTVAQILRLMALHEKSHADDIAKMLDIHV